MHDSQKRAITVQGRFMAPVCIGAPAFIRESKGYRKTSTVCAVLLDIPQITVIETQNSVYSIQKM